MGNGGHTEQFNPLLCRQSREFCPSPHYLYDYKNIFHVTPLITVKEGCFSNQMPIPRTFLNFVPISQEFIARNTPYFVNQGKVCSKTPQILTITYKFCPWKFWGHFMKNTHNWNHHSFPMSVESEHTGDMSLKPIKDSFRVVVMLKRIHITVKLVIFANSFSYNKIFNFSRPTRKLKFAKIKENRKCFEMGKWEKYLWKLPLSQ